MKTLALLVTSLLFAVFGFVSPARAATVITTGTDAELRAAVAACGDITFNFNGTITLTNAIDVACAVTIDASGHSVILSGGNSNRLFNVLPGGSLELLNLTIANGRKVGTNANHGALAGGLFGLPGESVEAGGILVSNAALSAWNCTFTNCTLQGGTGGDFFSPGAGGAASGGAIGARNSSLQLSNCLFTANAVTAGNSGLGAFVNDPSRTPGTGNGGAIHAINGTTIATNCQFNGNSANTSGGAININTAGSGTLNQCSFSGNLARISGGAVAFSGSGLGVRSSNFRNNTAAGTYNYSSISGGAMIVSAGTITITDCDFANNQCFGTPARGTPSGAVSGTSGNGGALAHAGGNSTISSCAFRENAAYGGNGLSGNPFSGSPATAQGGAVFCSAGSVEMVNSTLALNSVLGFLGANTAAGSGGAIAGTGGIMTIGSCTIASNRVSNATGNNASGGGIFVSSALVDIANSLLQGNSVNASPSSNFSGNNWSDFGHNLSSDATPAWNGEGSSNNLDSLLLPLANNGGPTLTMALRPGSPALNGADPGVFPATDQRGVARPQGTGSDIGAWEGTGGQITLSIFRENNSTNRITWLSDTGLTYRVEGATVLNAWSTLTTGVPGNGATVEYRTTNSGLRYFRVATEP